MSNNSALDTWSVISGAIGVLTVLPLICAYVWTQHPETKFAQLDSTLKETENLLRSVVEEGLLDPERHVAHFELHLKKFRRKTEQFRDETYMASNEWHKLFGAWYNGLSKRISLLCKKVKAVRATICETSANARMQLMQEAHDEVPPFHRRWCAKFAKFCKHIVSFACTRADVETIDAPSSTTSATLTSDDTSPTAGAATWEAVCIHSPAQPPSPSHKTPTQRPNLKFSRPSRRVRRTASRAQCGLHVLARALRHVDQELTAQGVTNALLAQLAQATHRQWSPASSKAHRPRRSRKQHRFASRPKRVLALQGASEPDIDSDVDSSGEETMCEV